MTKTIKKILISIFAAVTTLCAGFLLFGGSGGAHLTFAAEEEDTNFKFVAGAYTNYDEVDESVESDGLQFRLGFKVEKLTSICDNIANEPNGWWVAETQPWYEYYVNVYRKDESGNTKLYSLCYGFAGCAQKDTITIRKAMEKYVYSAFDVEWEMPGNAFTSVLFNDFKTKLDDGERSYEEVKKFDKSIFGSTKLNIPFDSASTMISIIPESPYVEYFVTFGYQFHYYSRYNMFHNTYDVSGSCQSSTRSLYTTFSNMEQAGALTPETFYDNEALYNKAYNIVHHAVDRTVRISYLEQIPETPFATKKTETAVVKMNELDDVLKMDVAAVALGKKTFDCLQSYADKFIKADGLYNYQCHYFNNIWLRAMTVDGNDYNYYLNINESYADYYSHFVDAGIFDKGAYETVFSSQLYANYSEQLAGYTPETIYGYFGFAIIPKTYGINTLWKEFFNTETSSSGVVRNFEYGVNLSLDAYQQLISDYNYSYLRRVWDSVANFFTSGSEDATCYILYAEPGTKTSFIGENGADDVTDDSGAAVKPIKNVGSFLGGVIDGITGGLKTVGTWFKNLGQNTRIVAGIIVAILAVILITMTIKIFNKKEK